MSESKDMRLNAKSKSSMKVFKSTCKFMRPGKIVKDGKMKDAKLCSAYVPSFEVDDERAVCEFCAVPDMTVREDRCRYFAPFDVGVDKPTRWFCRLLGIKNLEIERCNPKNCPSYDKCENLKWEIGKPIDKEIRENAIIASGQAKPASKRMFPKSSLKKNSEKESSSDDSGNYFDSGSYYF